MQQADAKGAQGVSLAAFAGKSHLFGISGLLLADKAGIPAAGEAGNGLDAALLAAFMGGQAGMPTDPALMGALAAQLVAGQGGLSHQVQAETADVAADGKELPLPAVAGQGRKAAAGSELVELAGDGGQPAEKSEVADAGARDLLKAGAVALSDEVVDLKAVETPLKAVNVQVGTEALATTGQAVARSDELALAGVVQQKGAPDGLSQASLTVRTPLQTANWAADFSQKVIWLAGRESQSAQLVLNPPQLGAVEVRLTMTGTEAGAQFFSPHQGVREAIEAAIPRLRDMMAEAGLSLGQASVSPESFRDSRANAEHAGQSAGRGGEDHAQDGGLSASEGIARATAGRGLVDLYV
ncbi:MAG: flagellar hook-length control protein FliK [Hydrogenophilaceae bacterium]|nr:flagellar hook-length control protein FliK [Hydrogenophilaceae bacterium]